MNCISQPSRYQLVLRLTPDIIMISMGSWCSREPAQRSLTKAWRLGRPLPARTTEAQKVGVLSLFCQTARGARVQPSSSSPHLTRTPVHCCRPSPPLPSPTPPPPGILWTRPREGSGRKTIIPRSSTDPPRRFRSWRTSGYGERKRM